MKTKYSALVVLLYVFPFLSKAQNIIDAVHETDDQLQVIIRFDAIPSSNAVDYTLDGGAIPIVGVLVSGTTAFLTLGSPVPVGLSSFSIMYNPTSSNGTSENNRPIICDDFRWENTGTPTDPCAPVNPVTVMAFSVKPGARNSSQWGADFLQIRVEWTGGTSFIPAYESDNFGVPAVNTNFVAADASTDAFTYPDNDPTCEYQSLWRPRIGIVNCPPTNANQIVPYASHNEDNEGGANLNLVPTVANTDLVCLNDEADMSFSDTSVLNCIADPNSPNNDERWVRVIYGDAGRADADRIPNVYVGGVQVTDASGALIAGEYIPTFGGGTSALGTGDIIGVVEFADPVADLPAGALDQITTIMTVGEDRDIGDRFFVTIEYWNICNAYVTGNVMNNQVSTQNFIEIIDIPPLPGAVDDEICEGDGLGGVNFEVTGTGGSTRINWYDNDPNLGGNLITNPNGNNSTLFPASSFPGGLDTNTPGINSIWATYVLGATNSCESDPVEIFVTVREELTQPGIISGTSSVCNNTNNVAFSVVDPPGNNPLGGAIEYQWTFDGGGGVNLNATTGNSITADFNIGGSFVTRTRRIRVRRRYADNDPDCFGPFRNFTVTIFGQTVGGSTAPDNAICEGDNTGVITLSGERGTILNWERQFNGGGFVNIGNGGNNDFDENLASSGVYEYRAVLVNGACTIETSSITTITVNPIPATPTISEVGDGLTICEDGSQTILQSNNVGGNADEYAWFRDPDLITPIQQTNSNQLVLSTVGESGRYFVQVIGVDPTDCESALSAPVDVVINPLPAASNPTGGGSVCAGNPAPDIVWTLTGTAPFDVTYTDGISTFGPIGEPTNTFTLTDPVTLNAGTYEITALTDANGCSGNALGGVATITVGGTPPAFDSGPTLDISNTCEDAPTADPELLFSLDDAGSASQSGFILTYNIDGGPDRTFTFNTDASGNSTANIIFTDSELDAVGTYDINLLSILSPSTCQTILTDILTFTVNPRPSPPTGPADVVACTPDVGTTQISVDDPSGIDPSLVIDWYAVPSGGTIVAGGAATVVFIPGTPGTFYAEVRNTSTGCQSTSRIPVTLTEDLLPSPADADADDLPEFLETCSDQLTLEATPADNGGTGTWSAPGLVYFENFESTADGTTSDGDLYGWSTDISSANVLGGDHFEVRNNRFEALNSGGGVAVWTSAAQDISGIANLSISVDALQIAGTLEPADRIEVLYEIDAGGQVSLGNLNDDFGSGTISGTIPSGGGTSLVLTIEVEEIEGDAEHVAFDNIEVRDADLTDLITFDDINSATATASGLPIGTTALTWTVSSSLGACPLSSESVNVERLPLPDANNINPQLCQDELVGVDLTDAVFSDAITGITGSAGRTIQYFSDPARTMPILPPTSYTVDAADPIVYVTVTDEATSTFPANFCTANATITFTINSLPSIADQNNLNNPIETVFCEETVASGDKDNVDLTTLDDDVADGITADRVVSWFSDAGLLMPILTPTDVDNVTTGTSFFARVEDTSTNCFDVAQVDITIEQRPFDNPIEAPDGSTPPTISVCRSTDDVLFFSINENTNPGSIYNWNVPTGTGELELVGGGTTNDFFVLVRAPNSIATPGVTLSVVETFVGDKNCDGNTNSINIVVDDAPPPPTINDPGPLCENDQNITLSLSSSTFGSTYFWDIGTLGSIVAGQGDFAITVNVGTTSDVVTVTETNATGCSSGVTSLPVTVNPRPAMNSSTSEQICSGEQVDIDAPLAFTSTIPGSTFEWEVLSRAGSLTGANVGDIGTGNINQILTNVSGVTAAVTYEVIPTSPAGCTGPAQIVTVTANSEPVGGPQTLIRCSDEPLNYDIQVQNINALGNNLSSVFTYTVTSSDEINFPTPPALDRTTASTNPITDIYTNTSGAFYEIYYDIVAIDPITLCEAAAPFRVTFRIENEPVGVDQTIDACSGVALSYDLQDDNVNVLGNGVNSNFRWQATDNGSVTGESTTQQIGDILDDLLENTSGTDQNVVYTVTPINDGNGCDGDPFEITVVVQSQPLGVDDVIDVCSNEGLAYDLQANINGVGGNGIPSTFIWIAADNPDPNVSGESLTIQTGSIINDNLINTTGVNQDVIYTIVPTSTVGDLCAGESFQLRVTVFPEPVGAVENIVTCSNDALNYDLQDNLNRLGNSTASTFEWEVVADNPDITGESVGIQTTGAITDNLVNTFATSRFVTYSVTPTDVTNNCEGNAFTVVVEVQGEPTGGADFDAVCSGDPISYDLQARNVDTFGNGLASSFTWTAAANPNVSGESTTPQTGNIINDIITNTSAADENVVYTVTPTDLANGCDGQSFQVTITIQSDPLGLDDVRSFCSDQSNPINYDLQDNVNTLGNGVNSDFTWQAVDNPNVTGESVTQQVGDQITDVLRNITGGPEVVNYTVVPTEVINGCEGAPFQVAITIESEPVAQDDNIAICSDNPVGYNLQDNVDALGGNGMNSNFSWEVVADNPNVTGESAGIQSGPIITDLLTNNSGINQDVAYRVIPQATSNSCFGEPVTITVTVNSEPAGNNESILICSRENVSYDLQNNINSPPLGNSQASNFTWVAANNLDVTGESTTNRTTASINDVLVNTSGIDQTVVYTVTPVGVNGCTGNNFVVEVTVQPEPVGVPDNSFSACSDQTLTYDLQANLSQPVPSTFIWVATPNAQVTGESVVPVTGGVIDDVITNTTGFPQIVSYTVSPESTNGCVGDDYIINITIDSEPLGQGDNTTICSRDEVGYNLQTQNIDALGNNMPSSFVWRILPGNDNPNITGMKSLTDQTGNVIDDELINTTGSDQSIIYTVTPTENGNNCIGNDFEVTVRVISEPVGVDLTELPVCSNDPFNFDPQNNLLVANGGNEVISTFTWTASYDVGVGGGSTTGVGAVNETLTNLTNGPLNAVYTITPRSQTGNCIGDAFTLTVPVNPEPVATNIVKPDLICSGDPFPGAGFDPQNETSIPSTFTWTSSYETGLNVLSAGTGAGVIQETLENLTGGTLNATYTVTPTSSDGCTGAPFTITVRINPEPVGSDITIGPTCSDVLFNINPQENINGNNSITSTFTWTATYDTGISGGSGSGTGQISESLTNTSGGILNAIYTITPTATGSLCPGDPFVITKLIDSEPLGTDNIQNAICSDDLIDIDPQNFITNGQTSSFTWTASYPAGLLNGVGSGTGNIIDVLSNETSGTLTAVYTVTPLDFTNGCFGNSFIIEQPITPEPSGFNEVKNAQCSNVGFNFDPQANSINGLVSTFTWTATYDAGLTGPSGAATLGSGVGPIVETLENLTGGQLLAEYRIIPTSGGCVGDEFVITVPVNAEPTAAVPAQAAICAREDFNLALQSFITNGITSTYSWTAVPDAGLSTTGQTTGSTNFINGNWINDTGGQLSVSYEVTPRGLASQCFGDVFSIIVPIDPSPVANDLTLDICSDVPSTLVASGVNLTALDATIDGGAGNTVTWFFDEFLNAPIGNPADHTVFDQIPIYANVFDGTCNKVAIVTYNIQPLPQVVGQVILDANGYSLSCEGADDGQITVNVSGAGVAGPFTYELFKEDPVGSGTFVSTGFTINDPSNTVTFVGGGANPPITSGLYVVDVTESGSGSNCVGRSFPVVVSDPFELSGGFVFGPQAICDGDAPTPFIQLAPAFGGIENYVYQWQLSIDGGTFTDIPGANLPTFSAGTLVTSAPNVTTVYTYRREVTSGSCTEAFSNEFDVTVNPLPQGDFEFYFISDLAEFNDTSTPNPAPIPGNQVCEGDAFFVGFDFTQGTEPFLFDYDDGTNFNVDENGAAKTAIPFVTGIESPLTITLSRISDVFGCEIIFTPPLTKTLDVINVDLSLTINDAPACSGDPVNFTFNFDADVEYVLNYGDGTSDFFAANSAPPGPFTTPDKTYSSGALVNTIFQVVLSAQSTLNSSCSSASNAQNVQIFANVFANVTPETTSICSGESILFQNNSLGVTNNNWFYREQGTTQEIDPRTNPGDQTFTFTNTTNTDPLIYEVVYTADNGNCDDQVIIPIEVYKGFDADFDIVNATVFTDRSDVTLSQLSTPGPPEDAFFNYNWSFGLDATPQTAVGYNPPAVVTYSEPGNKTITLTITNLAAQSDGISCTDVHQETILIPLPPITAEFTINPNEGCSPLEVETTNLSVGAISYEWEVRDSENTPVAQSNERDPIFTLNDPGDYTILLQTSYPVPNGSPETAFAEPQSVTVFRNPVADFRSNQEVIFIPDQPFRPINNSSTFVTDFLWDWGDGSTTAVGPGQSPFVQHVYEEEGMFTVLLTVSTDYDGIICSDTTSLVVDVQEGGFTRTPNAFTPSLSGPRGGSFDPRNPSSAGGINDVFLPITEGVQEFQMVIFDRWGNLIFESNDKNFGWDGYDSKGNLLPAGVYVYRLDLLLSDGNRTTRVGDVTLIR